MTQPNHPRGNPSATRLLRNGGATFALFLVLTACASLRPPPMAVPETAMVSTLERFSPNPCNPAVASVLAGANVPLSNIRSVAYGLYRDEITGRIIRYDAWVGLKDQPGSIVVTVDDTCRPIQIYAREGARLPVAAR
ncbi:hypothetical protein [Azospirillum doebereinerae]